jgi:hypothetical protein
MAHNPLEGVEKADETVKRREKRALTLDELGRLKVRARRITFLTRRIASRGRPLSWR